MSKQGKQSIVELIGVVAFATFAIIQWGVAAGLGATVAAVFIYGIVSVMFKFGRVKKMAMAGASRLASSD